MTWHCWLARRLAGLPNRRLLVTRSPGKAFTPQPGEYAVTWHCCGFFPAKRSVTSGAEDA
ncbi:hypothetical protein [Klebsiella michiganensis]|uniref:hypothetical protein n=1 Tax=Klebsiella michiganensis TaxID=1134687 RepID=UPI001F152E52|nr:hypothetical protein [Klebsiella michiganensis]